MILADVQGSIWNIGRIRWLGSRQYIPIKNPRALLSSGGLTGDIIELVLLVLFTFVVLVPMVLGTLEYLIKLLIRPLRLLLQPSARAAGWEFDLVQIVPSGAPVNADLAPVRMHIRVGNRASARYLRKRLIGSLPQGDGLRNFQLAEAFQNVGATVSD